MQKRVSCVAGSPPGGQNNGVGCLVHGKWRLGARRRDGEEKEKTEGPVFSLSEKLKNSSMSRQQLLISPTSLCCNQATCLSSL